MNGIESFDELNSLVGYKRSTPYEEWFGEMALSEAQIQERIRFAERLEEELEEELAYLFYAYPTIRMNDVEDLKNRYLDVLMMFGLLPFTGQYNYQQQQLYDHADRFAAETIASTQAHQDTPYYYSEDRARFMAENETNIVYNTDDFWNEVEAGATKKTWVTMQDNKVRESHMEINGEEKDIDEPFFVGGSLMLFPGDESLGAGAEEIVNCRCTLECSGYIEGANDWIFAKQEDKKRYSSSAADDGTKAETIDNIAQEWDGEAEDSNEIIVGETKYRVDGRSVVFEHSSSERDIALKLSKLKGETILLLPRINIPQNISSADFETKITGTRYELKSIEGNSRRTIKKRISESKKQADRFVINITEKSDMSLEFAEERIRELFKNNDTAFLQEAILFYHGEYFGTYNR